MVECLNKQMVKVSYYNEVVNRFYGYIEKGGPNMNWGQLNVMERRKQKVRNGVTQKTYQQLPKGRGRRN